MTRAYYVLKPSIPGKVRLAVRRLRAERLSRRLSGVWYINETARTAPDGWPGWPDGKQFAFVLTHDVDSKRGFDRCLQVAEMDRRLGFRASFNFVPEGPYIVPASLRDSLAGQGFEIGVHDLRDDGTGYVELPYTLPQDSTLFVLLRERSIETWKRKLEWVAEHGGMALVNVHPDYMNFDGRPASSEYGAHLYQDFLEYVRARYGRHAWFALPRDVAAYVRREGVLPRPRLAASDPLSSTPERGRISGAWRLRGKRAAMVVFSYYPADPRPRRAAEALVNEGMEVEVVCLKDGEAKRQTLNGVKIVRVPMRRRRGGMFEYVFQYAVFVVLSLAILAVRSMRRRYHVVYVHNMPDVLVLSALVPKAQGAKVILDLHDPMPELMMSIFNLPHDSLRVRTLERLEKWSIRFADLALTVNLACKRLFVSRSCPPEKVQVVMNSPDEKIFGVRAPRPAPSMPRAPGQPFVIMYHGSLVERNGLHLAVDALARVRRSVPSAALRIYGPSSPFLERVMQSVRAQGLTSAVQYLGPIRLEDIVGAIEDCDVGVIPNQRSVFTEINTPTRIFEYLAVGKPVIAPRAGGIRDYFDEESLIFFELGDVADLAQKIEYVFFHPAEAAEIAGRGQDVYRAHAWRAERQTLVNLAADLVSR